MLWDAQLKKMLIQQCVSVYEEEGDTYLELVLRATKAIESVVDRHNTCNKKKMVKQNRYHVNRILTRKYQCGLKGIRKQGRAVTAKLAPSEWKTDSEEAKIKYKKLLKDLTGALIFAKYHPTDETCNLSDWKQCLKKCMKNFY